MTGTTRTGTPGGTRHTTRYDRWAYRTMNDARMRHLHATAGRRRLFVAAHVLLTAGATSGVVLLTATGQPGWAALPVAVLLVWVPVTGVLNSATRGLLELRSRMLDERQVHERATVHALAHRVSFLVMLTAFAGLAVAHGAGAGLDALAPPIAVTGLGVLVVHWLLPLWIAVLRAPDEPGPDEDDAFADDDGEAPGRAPAPTAWPGAPR
ncbi:hypothetical protein [Streptomyces sp. JJ36]|uniref:hypothetical protein n=1 Tax=Streptomyces sp. JJ36 TaxID=2736645 RepID=UPI001F47F9CF|nr:hypothetical protein [Streptomyces sp. JJ36]